MARRTMIEAVRDAMDVMMALGRFRELQYVLPADLRAIIELLRSKYSIGTLNDGDGYPAQIGKK
jgi:hypothetical protein